MAVSAHGVLFVLWESDIERHTVDGKVKILFLTQNKQHESTFGTFEGGLTFKRPI